MLCINLINSIKTPILLQMTTSRTFLSFMIIMMVIIMTWEHHQVVVLTQMVVLMYNTWGPSCL